MNCTSHELARDMHKLADALQAAPEFETDSVQPHIFMYFWNKEKLVAFARALSSLGVKKEYRDNDFRLAVDVGAIGIHAAIRRSRVCVLVEEAKPAVYECEPLLSPEEDAALIQDGE